MTVSTSHSYIVICIHGSRWVVSDNKGVGLYLVLFSVNQFVYPLQFTLNTWAICNCQLSFQFDKDWLQINICNHPLSNWTENCKFHNTAEIAVSISTIHLHSGSSRDIYTSIWVRFLRTGIGPKLCDFFKKIGLLLWPNVSNNAVFFNWSWKILFYLPTRGKKYGSLWRYYITLYYTLKCQYNTVKCSTSNSSPIIKQSEQTQVVSPCKIRCKTMSEPTGNILIYTTQQYTTLS